MVNYGYLLKRVSIALLSLFIISSLIFVMTTALPGSAANIVLGTDATPDRIDELESEMGLDQPLHERYLDYVVGTFTLDWGESLISDQPVVEPIVPAFFRTLELAVVAMGLSIVTAIPFGILTAAQRDSIFDSVVSGLGYIGVSIPTFVSGTLLLLLFTRGTFGFFPSGGYVSPGSDPIAWLSHMILPAVTLNIVIFAYVMRQTRSSMIETLESDYIRTARLKGIPERSVLLRHALRNGLLPTVTIIALNVGWLMGSVVIVEEIFSYPGIGRLLIDAINQRDLPVIQAAIMVPTAAFIFANLTADILYTYLDPRISLGDS
jgi:peptide/nickel transport system permease protein